MLGEVVTPYALDILICGYLLQYLITVNTIYGGQGNVLPY